MTSPYPWAGFGEFLFEGSEAALFGSDSGWNRQPSYARTRALGSTTDTILTIAGGSSERSFDCYLTPARYSELSGLLNSTAEFCDWERPIPTSRQAFLSELRQVEWTAVLCSDGLTRKKIRATVTLVSQ